MLIVMKRMSFGDRWIKWINWCISTTSFSILINGTPVGFIQSSKDVRGKSFISYLFILEMEVPSHLFSRAVDGNFIVGCKFKNRRGELVLSHLFYVDDILIFCENKEQLVFS